MIRVFLVVVLMVLASGNGLEVLFNALFGG